MFRILVKSVAALAVLTLIAAGCGSAPPATAPRPELACPAPAPVGACPACPAPVACPACPACPPPSLPPTPPAKAPTLTPGSFADLPGWDADDHAAALAAFRAGCAGVRRPGWRGACDRAQALGAAPREVARMFFESEFAPHSVSNEDGTTTGMVTGYYEPLLRGNRSRAAPYLHPLYAAPDDLIIVDLGAVSPETRGLRLRGRLEGRKLVPYYDRAAIDAGRAPIGGKEIVYVDDPIEAFFLQIQGSGRVRLPDGSSVRLGFDDHNGHPYRSIGRWLIDRGEMTLAQASMQGIQAWARANPQRLPELLAQNPSYVFFREIPSADLPENMGPSGALGVPLAPERSIAVDARFIPLGAPVYLATTRPNSNVPLERLMAAQDTGGAIRGAVRADFFWGFGPDAGREAGRMRQTGRMWVLLPRNGNGGQ